MMMPDYARYMRSFDDILRAPRIERRRLDGWWAQKRSTIVGTPIGGAICCDDGQVEIYAERL